MLAFAAGAQAQNLVINGDFEVNGAPGTMFNNSNALFTATMATSSAFGGSDELDIVTANDFGIPAQSGAWKVGMHQRTNDPNNVDAFSLALSAPTNPGQAYTLSYFATALPGSFISSLEIGLSNNPADFGVLIHSGTPADAVSWSAFSTGFVAPGSFAFLTVRNTTQPADGYVFVDNISLVPAPGAAGVLGAWLLVAGRRRR